VVVPDRIVQAKALVALPPRVARALVPLDDDRRNAEPPQPCAERDTALPPTDDDHVRLFGKAERRVFFLTSVQPGLAAWAHAMLGPLDAPVALALLEALEFGHRRQQRPRLAVAQAQVAATAGHRRFEGEPGFDHAVGLGRLSLDRECGRPRVGQPRFEHRANRFGAFLGPDVPGECDEVAPVAVGLEQRDRRIDVVALHRRHEICQPGACDLRRVG
jgi:hypothetical protein